MELQLLCSINTATLIFALKGLHQEDLSMFQACLQANLMPNSASPALPEPGTARSPRTEVLHIALRMGELAQALRARL